MEACEHLYHEKLHGMRSLLQERCVMQHGYNLADGLKRILRNMKPGVEGGYELLADVFSGMREEIFVRSEEYLTRPRRNYYQQQAHEGLACKFKL